MAIEQPSNSGIDAGISKDDILEELNKDDEEVTPSDEDKEEKPDDEDSDDKDEDKDEDKEADSESKDEEDEIKLEDPEGEEDLKEIKFVAPFRKADIEKDFPGIFKKYPYLEKSYYTEKQYRDIFPTLDDAREAQEQVEQLQSLEQSIIDGSTDQILSRVKEHDSRAFRKVVDNYLPSLQKVDPAAHQHIVGGIVKNLISMMAAEGRRSDNDEFRKVALAINRFVFESDKFEPHKPLAGEEDADDEEVEKNRQFIEERFNITKEDLQSSVDNVLNATITKYIDPNESLSDYVKKNAIRDAMDNLREVVDSDKSFRKTLDKLWMQAYQNNFRRDSVKKIKDAYLSKAKSVIAPVVKKARSEALKGMGRKVREEKELSGDSEKPRTYAKSKRGSLPSNAKGQSKPSIPKGMTTLQFLSQD